METLIYEVLSNPNVIYIRFTIDGGSDDLSGRESFIVYENEIEESISEISEQFAKELFYFCYAKCGSPSFEYDGSIAINGNIEKDK